MTLIAHTPIDVAALKARVDLPELASRYTTLTAHSTDEQAGPCPRSTCTAKTDGFHVHADGWFLCHTCHPQLGDAIEFLQWLGVVADFQAACQYLDASLAQTPALVRQVLPQAKPENWRDPQWQSTARAKIARGQACLTSAAGDPGAEYLLHRGLLPETWQAWDLGYDPAKFDPATARPRPAIVIPWQGAQVTAVKYRFTDSISKGDRFTQLGGGQQIAFGLHRAGTHWGTLWLVEGEFNALSIWQALALTGYVGFDVVSFGGDGRAAHPAPVVLAWAGRYRQVIIWADEPAKTAACGQAITGAFTLCSPEVAGQKLDANQMLQAGGLADFARAAWAKCDQDPAYTARLRAEIEG